jgi:pimeloyl-ACP methyl ester carboxylesterase
MDCVEVCPVDCFYEGYAFAAEHPDRVTKFILIDAPLPCVGPWDDIVRSHALWHFSALRFEQFKAFDQDATDNKAFLAKGKLTMPVLAVGGEKSFAMEAALSSHRS